MIFGLHCDTSLAIADAIITRRPFTAIRMSDGQKMREPLTLHLQMRPFHPKAAA